jgi:hypothetical protein
MTTFSLLDKELTKFFGWIMNEENEYVLGVLFSMVTFNLNRPVSVSNITKLICAVFGLMKMLK